jgi:hypothetical protein
MSNFKVKTPQSFGMKGRTMENSFTEYTDTHIAGWKGNPNASMGNNNEEPKSTRAKKYRRVKSKNFLAKTES